MHVGFFSETIPAFSSEKAPCFSLAHVDLSNSVQDALHFIYPWMLPNAIIIFDDYGPPTCLGAKKAADEFFRHKHEQVVGLPGPQYGCTLGGA
ncbi:MAG: hypothetical protein C4325_09895 [Blastocatellia bacterium]